MMIANADRCRWCGGSAEAVEAEVGSLIRTSLRCSGDGCGFEVGDAFRRDGEALDVSELLVIWNDTMRSRRSRAVEDLAQTIEAMDDVCEGESIGPPEGATAADRVRELGERIAELEQRSPDEPRSREAELEGKVDR